MGYKNSDPCLQKAFDDERLFILMTRDETAPEVVLEWIKLNIHNQSELKLREAFEAAMEMKNRRAEFHRRKLKDGGPKIDDRYCSCPNRPKVIEYINNEPCCTNCTKLIPDLENTDGRV